VEKGLSNVINALQITFLIKMKTLLVNSLVKDVFHNYVYIVIILHNYFNKNKLDVQKKLQIYKDIVILLGCYFFQLFFFRYFYIWISKKNNLKKKCFVFINTYYQNTNQLYFYSYIKYF
jgi:hypothetical protein